MTHARAHISIGDVRYTTLNVYDIYNLQGGLCVRRVFPPVGLKTVQIYPLGHPSVGERASERVFPPPPRRMHTVYAWHILQE
jgi:hypothetical protein